MKFEPGINVVVGPNGSGKSNVVDALAWVMGEQGAKNLRGGAMADVIFAGTAKRPALGRAEVSLTIDNTDGALPIDFSEVTISRTLFRSGGSEYAINGTPCRLLDIQELLSDTGMGREMHVIIGQGKLDQVLSATPEERRSFIEEAAGVLKHRRRKEKALRKLDSMQGNLTRIEDLAAELRRQLGPLARQAATARRAQVIQSDVYDAKARLLADDLAQAQARLESEAVDDTNVTRERENVAAELRAARDRVNELQMQSDLHEPRVAQLSEQYQRLSSLRERLRSLADLAHERENSLRAVTPSANRGESPEHIRERAAREREAEAKLREEVSQAQETLESAVAARGSAEERERDADSRLAATSRSLADRRESAARLAGQISAVKTRLESLEAEKQRVASAMTQAQERLESGMAEVDRLEQDAVARSESDDTLSIAHEEAARELQAAKDALEQAREDVAAKQALAVQWQTKADTLELSLEPEDASGWVTQHHRSGVRGLVQDELQVRGGWESALETALRGLAGGVLVEDVDAAVDALRAVRSEQAGHVELVIASDNSADRGKSEADVQARAILEASGLSESEAMLASDALESAGAASALGTLLEGTILAIDLVVARQLVAAGAERVATSGGDVVGATWASGGEVQVAAVLARKATYEDARRQAQSAKLAHERAREASEAAQAHLANAQQEFDSVASELGARDSQLAAVTAQLGVMRQSLDAARKEIDRDNARIAAIDKDLVAREQEREKLAARQAEFEHDPSDLAAQVSELTALRDKAHEATVSARRVETDARLALRTAEERLRSVEGRADSLERTAKAAQERIEMEQRAAARRAEAAKYAAGVAEKAQRAQVVSASLAVSVAAERDRASAAGAQRRAELTQARDQVEKIAARERDLADMAHQRELLLAQLRLGFDQLAGRALEELGMDVETLIAEFGPHLPVPVSEDKSVPFVRAEQEKRLAKAQKDLVKLGKINPLALEEHAALEERQKYLAEQLQDLRRSREDLLTIVKDIDARVSQVMEEAIKDVQEAFVDVFARLFPGGEGRVVVTDPDSILTTGIDIEGRPAGKRVKRLSLLSGGERSLTAVAFLVAIFKARPSPFYVMDEVEAALDDVNLSRLLEIFKELQMSSQLLVITHQKRTMEIADTIYGIAMREHGVTSVISQRMADLRDE